MSLERQPILRYGGPTTKPSLSDGTITVETSCGGSSVRQATTTNPEMGVPLFVMKDFEPSIVQAPSARRAVVRRARTSEPPEGSVSPKLPRISPAATRGSHRCFCSSVPCRAIMPPARPEVTDRVTATLESTRPSSSITRAHVTASAPSPP